MVTSQASVFIPRKGTRVHTRALARTRMHTPRTHVHTHVHSCREHLGVGCFYGALPACWNFLSISWTLGQPREVTRSVEPVLYTRNLTRKGYVAAVGQTARERRSQPRPRGCPDALRPRVLRAGTWQAWRASGLQCQLGSSPPRAWRTSGRVVSLVLNKPFMFWGTVLSIMPLRACFQEDGNGRW